MAPISLSFSLAIIRSMSLAMTRGSATESRPSTRRVFAARTPRPYDIARRYKTARRYSAVPGSSSSKSNAQICAGGRRGARGLAEGLADMAGVARIPDAVRMQSRLMSRGRKYVRPGLMRREFDMFFSGAIERSSGFFSSLLYSRLAEHGKSTTGSSASP